jgi:hypothetical protein
MTGAKLSIRQFEKLYDSLLVNPVLKERMRKVLEEKGFGYIQEERQPADSTDLGTISLHIPTFYGYAGVGDGKTRIHEEKFAGYVNTPESNRKAVICAESMAECARDFMCAEAFRNAVKVSFSHSLNKESL